MMPNVQIEGLADHKTWTEPRKFKNTQAVKRTLIGQSLSNAGLGVAEIRVDCFLRK